MSPFFVKFFKSNNPCPICSVKAPTDKAPGKSLCGAHLRLAKLCWVMWFQARRAAGRCVACPKKALVRNCRCSVHREKNRQKCIRWIRANPGYRDKCLQRKEAWIAQGKCPACPQHRSLEPGLRRCSLCRTKQRATNDGDRLTVREIAAQNQTFKEQRRLAAVEQARADLLTLGYVFTVKRGGHRSLQRVA